MSTKEYILILLVMAIAAIFLYKSPYYASNLEIVPDSVEYAASAHNFAIDGTCFITVNGEKHPSRYAPWFPALILAPAFFILGDEPGNAIYPVTLFGIIGIITAFFVSRKVAGTSGAVFSALLVLLLPVYRYYGKQVMSDVPCAALVMLECFVYLRLMNSEKNNPIGYVCAGMIAALGGALRPAYFCLVLPFLAPAIAARPLRIAAAQLTALIVPGIAVALSSMIYNGNVFGSVIRTGYNYWCPVPYDYFDLVFSFSFFRANFNVFLLCGVPAIAAAAFLLEMAVMRTKAATGPKWKSSVSFRNIWKFTFLATGPIAVIHLFYFFPEERFFLPILCMTAIIAGSAMGMYRNYSFRTLILICAIFLAGAVLYGKVFTEEIPSRRIAADIIMSSTPDNAMVISSIDPVYLELMACRSSQRRILPMSRRVEYASKVITNKKLAGLNPPPAEWTYFRRQDLIKAGAQDVFPATAAENPDLVIKEIGIGTQVYLDTSHVPECDMNVVSLLRNKFNLTRQAENLYKLAIKN